jgi:uncharacterized protein
MEDDPIFRRRRMSRIAVVAGALAALLVPLVAQAQAKPLKIGYYTGGGYHDYKGQAKYLPTELEKQINATVEVKWEREALRDPELGKGFDVVIYNICWADDKKDEDLVEKVPKVTFEGKPTVFLHCALHCFRWSENAWTESMGMTSRSHDAFSPLTLEKAEKNHPICKALPDEWKTPGDEPYVTLKMWPNAKSLLTAKSPPSGKVNTVAWVNQYGKGKVFATTLGHDMKTMQLPEFIKLVAAGTLWTVDKLGEDGKPKAGYGK